MLKLKQVILGLLHRMYLWLLELFFLDHYMRQEKLKTKQNMMRP